MFDDVILVLAEFFSVLAMFFPYWPTFSRIGRVVSVLAEFAISMMRADFTIQILYEGVNGVY